MVKEERVVVEPSLPQKTNLRIYLLGPMRIEHDGGRIHLPRRKVESLLAYLLLHPEPHTRDQLAALFWGDSSDSQARHSLRTALATVRQQISPDLLLTDREHVQLNPDFDCWVDLDQLLALESQLEQANFDVLQTTMALWQGELLAGFYDEWIATEREYYRTQLLKLFLQVTQTLRARSEYAKAIQVAQHILTFDPANEQAHQHLMFCYVASGDRPAALRQYELCASALLADLDAPPMPETTALYQWIKQNNGEISSAAAKITNLPIPLTSFVGRTRETAEVKGLLTQGQLPSSWENFNESPVRLLTLTGAGGSGKTRLAIQVATDLIDRFRHGVWWVELAALTDAGLVVRALAKTLGVNEVPDQPLSQTVIDFIGSKQLLLVLDNCEHLIEPCAHIAAELLGHCPNLQILATSREPLNVAGEMLWQVPTLAVPNLQQVTLNDLLLQHECIRLFYERAVAVQPSFRLTLENAEAVVDICARLDGIPLAIELAAARVKVLPVAQIAAYLTRAIGARFALLTQGSRTVLPRQQTLRAAIDWSYDLLNEDERVLFRHLAVFHGGFTLETLEQVLIEPSASLLDLLTQLVDKSLVIVEPHGGENRYRLLETLREYALEQWQTTEELQGLQRRHAEVFLALAEQAGPALNHAQQQYWLTRLETELANLRGALDHLLNEGAGEQALRLATAIQRFWDSRGYVSEGRDWLRKGLALRQTATLHTQARALDAAGRLAWRQGEFVKAQALFTESLSYFEQEEDEIGIASALFGLATIDMEHGNYQIAQQRIEQGLQLSRTTDYKVGIGRAFRLLGGLAWDLDKFVESREYYQESLRVHQALGDQFGIANTFLNIGDCERVLGNVDAARQNYEDCLAISRSLGLKGLTGAALKSLGMAVFRQQDYVQAQAYAEESLRIFREVGDKAHIGFAYSNLGDVARKLGDSSKALSYYCQNLQIMVELGYKWPIFDSLEYIARLLVDVDQHLEEVVIFLGAADHLRQETNITVPPHEQETYERRVQQLRQRLGDTAFDTLWAAGQQMPLAEVVSKVTMLSLT